MTIGDSVTSIDNYTFQYCSALKSVTIGDSVMYINYAAFESCSALESVTMPDSVTTLGNLAFQNCTALHSVTISNSVTRIPSYVFKNCSSLQTITIPDSVTNIGSDAFPGTDLNLVIMNPVVKDNLSLEFGANQSFYGKDNVTIVNRETYGPEKTLFTHTNGTVYTIDIVGELVENSYSSTISKSDIVEVRIGTNVTSMVKMHLENVVHCSP